MRIRTKLFLLVAGLIGAVVLSIAAAVATVERRELREQSRRRVEALTDGVSRLAQESLDARDPLMLVSYVMALRQEHPELAFAAVTRDGHTAALGEDAAGLVHWQRTLAGRHPVKYTVTAVTSAPDAAGSVSFSSGAVSLRVPGDARVSVDEARAPETVALRLGFSPAALEAETADAFRPLARRTASVAGLFLLAGWLGALSLSKLITTPLLALTAAAGRIEEGDLGRRVTAETDDEVGALGRRFNAMSAALARDARLREDLLHTLTHELNTPLAGLKGYLELLRDGKLAAEGPERDEAVMTMSAAVLRMEHSLGSALSLFRSGAGLAAGTKTVVWVDDLLREAVALFGPVARDKGVELLAPPERATKMLYADEELLRQIVLNLVSNALKYTPEGGRVRLGLSGGKDGVRIRVLDTGRGVAASDLPNLFTKFYRSGADGRRTRIPGTGLGLSIAMKAARAHGGDIAVRSRLGRGTVFTVTIPHDGKPQEKA